MLVNGIMEDKTELVQQCQLESFAILLEFQQICEALGLRFYLTAGTLLGAVRHKGFIPWDDDIDVVMPREDYEKLARLAHRLLSKSYLYQSGETDPHYPFYFAKIRRLGTHVAEPVLRGVPMEQGFYIDIFPLDPCPEADRFAAFFFKGMELLTCALFSRISTHFVCGYQKKYMRLLWEILRKLPNQLLLSIREGLRKAAGRAASGKRLCTVGGAHGYPRETFQAEWFEESVQLEFEGYSFPAPAGWDALLRNMYGDYMILPPEEERQGHFIEKTEGEKI